MQEVFSGAILLKRMAFVIFSGEVDQYINYLPDIQGNITLFKKILQMYFVFLCRREVV